MSSAKAKFKLAGDILELLDAAHCEVAKTTPAKHGKIRLHVRRHKMPNETHVSKNLFPVVLNPQEPDGHWAPVKKAIIHLNK